MIEHRRGCLRARLHARREAFSAVPWMSRAGPALCSPWAGQRVVLRKVQKVTLELNLSCKGELKKTGGFGLVGAGEIVGSSGA